MLKNFPTELDRRGVSRIVTTTIRETVALRPRAVVTRTHLAVDTSQWTWREFRDYVMGEIEARFGPSTPADPLWPRKEVGIYKSFLDRWGAERAVAICRYAFDACDGRWQGQPITPYQFCKGSDPHFASPIAERLHLV
jgi:hypothetical protein